MRQPLLKSPSSVPASSAPRTLSRTRRVFAEVQTKSEIAEDSTTDFPEKIERAQSFGYNLANISIAHGNSGTSLPSSISPNSPLRQTETGATGVQTSNQTNDNQTITIRHQSSPTVQQKMTPSWGKFREQINRGTAHNVQTMWGKQPAQGLSQPQPTHSYIGSSLVQRDHGRKEVSPQERKAEKDYQQFTAKSYQWPNYTIGLNGKFDLDYQPGSNLVNINVKVRFEFPDIKGGWLSQFIQRLGYVSNYITQVQNAWSKRYTFKNVREPQSVWGKLNPTNVQVNVIPVKANEHFLIQAYLHKAGRAQVAGGVTKLYKGDETPQPEYNAPPWDTKQGELARIQRINPTPIPFANNSDHIPPVYNPKLNFLSTYLKRINNPKFNIDVIGHSSATGAKDHNQKLSEKRAIAVETALKNAGLTNHNLHTSGVGDIGATASGKWQKVDIIPKVPAGWQNLQAVTPHEFGHMVGLGDEYWLGKGKAQKTTHYDLVVKAFGKQYAQKVAMRESPDTGMSASIMFGGSDVRLHHYVTFWAALCDTTLKKANVPAKRFGYTDWKFIG